SPIPCQPDAEKGASIDHCSRLKTAAPIESGPSKSGKLNDPNEPRRSSSRDVDDLKLRKFRKAILTEFRANAGTLRATKRYIRREFGVFVYPDRTRVHLQRQLVRAVDVR